MVDGSIRIDTKIDQTGVNKGLADIEKSCTSFVGVASGILAGISVFEFGKSALKSTADIELAQAKLTTLLGSADQAQSMINDIIKMADVTPYNSTDLIQAATTLKTFGVNADQIMPTLTALGNAAGGQAQNLQGVAYALGQTAAQGKMMTQDLYQFINAGVPLLALLAKRLNKSKAEIKGMVEAGKIGYAEVNGALQEFYTGNGKYAGLMAQAAKTLPGMWSTFQDSITSFGRELVAVLEPSIKSALGTMTKMFSSLAGWLKALTPDQKEWLATAFKGVAVFLALAVATTTASKAWAAFNIVLRANPILFIIGLVAGLIAILDKLRFKVDDIATMSEEDNKKSASLADGMMEHWRKLQGFFDTSESRDRYVKATVSGFDRITKQLGATAVGTKEWSNLLVQAEARSAFLSDGRLYIFAGGKEAYARVQKIKALLDEMAKKAAAGKTPETEGEGGTGTAEEEAAIKRRKALWEEYHAWETAENYGSMEADLYVLHTKHAAELDAIGESLELRTALEEKYNASIESIKQKWSDRHKVAAFLYGLGMTEKTAEGMESGLFSIVHATKEIGEAIADTFEVIGDVFDFGAAILDAIVDFDYASTEKAVTDYVSAIGDFFKNELGAIGTLIFKTLIPAVEGVVAELAANLPATLATIANLMQSVAAYLTTNAPALISQILAIVGALISAVAENLPTLAGALARGFLQLLTGAIDFLPSITRGLIDAFIAVFGEVVKAAPALIDGIMAAVAYAFSYLAQNAGTIAGQLVTLALKVVEGVVRNLPMIVQSLIQAIPLLVTAIFEDVPQAIIAELPTMIEEMIPALVALIPQLFVELPAVIAASSGQALIAAAVLMPAEFLKASPAIIKALVLSLARMPEQLYKEFSRMAGNAWKGFVEGLKRAGDIWSKVKRVFTGFVDAVKNFFGIHSPSTMFMSFGMDIITGLVMGMFNLAAYLATSALSIMTSAVSGLLGILDFAASVGAAIVSGIATGITSVGGAVWGALKACLTFDFSGVLSTIFSFGQDIIKHLGAGVTSMWSGLQNLFSFNSDELAGSIASIGSTIVDAIKSGITAPINLFIDAINEVISTLNKIHVKLPKWLGGYSFGIDLPKIDKLEKGTKSARGGWTVVGEKGPELMNMKAGSTVLNASDSIRAVMAALTPRSTSAATGQSVAFAGEISAADVVIDGNSIGKIAFRYIDKQVKAAYGAR